MQHRCMVKGQSTALYALAYSIRVTNGVLIASVVGHAKPMREEWWVTGCPVSDLPRLMTIMWPRVRLAALQNRRLRTIKSVEYLYMVLYHAPAMEIILSDNPLNLICAEAQLSD